MSDLTNTGEWIRFFRDAGLPANVAANYAIIFYDNRIQINMLMDLTKEYLYDMGIRTMGDVIAILKHAKEYHTELAKEKMIGNISQLSPPKRSSPASRMLGRLTRPAESFFPSESSSYSHNVLSMQTKRAYPVMSKPTTIISLKKTASESFGESAAKRARRVLPEEEGGYHIKMPAGSTERSRKILQKQQQLQLGTKKSVFSRLGDSDVSSSTDIQKSKSSSSVFDRLGSSNEVSTSTSTISTGKIQSISGQPLQYQGVLKRDTVRLAGPSSKITVTKRLGTKPAVTPQSNRTVFKSSRELRSSGVTRINEILSQHAKSLGQEGESISRIRAEGVSGGVKTQIAGRSILNRLGDPPISKMTVSTGVLASRLGKRTVFDRLGN